jgi:hypothetical protein
MCLFYMYFAHVLWQKNCCHQRDKWLLTYFATLIELVFQLRMRLCRPEAILIDISCVIVFTILPEGHEVDTHAYTSRNDK